MMRSKEFSKQKLVASVKEKKGTTGLEKKSKEKIFKEKYIT
jgi:hypothetical protein